MAYADTNLTIEQVEHLIVGIEDFNVRQHIVVPNVSWGFLNHEADLLLFLRKLFLLSNKSYTRLSLIVTGEVL